MLCGIMKEGNRMELWKWNLYICWFGFFCIIVGMSLVILFLLFYIEKLGVYDISFISRWVGIVFGFIFLMVVIVFFLWGSLVDKYGWKFMFFCVSLGMVVVMIFIGFV